MSWRDHEAALLGGNLFGDILGPGPTTVPMKPYVPPEPEDDRESGDAFGRGEAMIEPPDEEMPDETEMNRPPGETVGPLGETKTAATETPAPPDEQMALIDAPSHVAAIPDIRSALRQLREYRNAAPVAVREAVDVVLARLEPEYEELILIYVHFERVADVADLGKIIGVPLSSSVRQVRYSRDHAETIGTNTGDGQRAERDKSFADLQGGLFEIEEWWVPLWRGMPEFEQRDLAPVYSIEMTFASWDDVDHFEKIIDQTVPRGPKRTPSVWFPEAEIGRIAGRAWVDKSDERWRQGEAASQTGTETVL